MRSTRGLSGGGGGTDENWAQPFFVLRPGRGFGIIDALNPSDAQGAFCMLPE